MNVKEYKDARICLLDFDAVYQSSVKDVIRFCSKNNIKLKGLKGDTAKIFYHYLIDNIYRSYNTYNTPYNKVYGVNLTTYNDRFIRNVLSAITVPWCKITNFNNPDNKCIAINAVNKNKNHYKQICNFVSKHNLNKLQKKLNIQKSFSNGVVDLSKTLN
jgi:hypothetical protein